MVLFVIDSDLSLYFGESHDSFEAFLTYIAYIFMLLIPPKVH